MNKQEFYRAKYQKTMPDWQNCLELFTEIVNENCTNNSILIDIGCGHADYLIPIYNKVKYACGVDTDKEALKKNKSLQHKFLLKYESNEEKLPFGDDYFDIAIMSFVVEHFKNPEIMFKEIFRVLKPKGKVIFLTPNALNYNVWISKIVPKRLHDRLVRWLYHRGEKDTYLALYKINTGKKIHYILNKIGFNRVRIIYNGDPSYISFNNIFFAIGVLLEKILNIKRFNFLRVHIIAVYQK